MHFRVKSYGALCIALFLTLALLPIATVDTARAISPDLSADSSATSWVAKVASADSSDGAWNQCTGSLISNNWVLTAKHCVVNSMGYTYVNLGAINKINWEFDVDRIERHSDYDAALLHLTKSAAATPIAFARTTPISGMQATAYGWGGSSRLTEADLHVVGEQDNHLYLRPPQGTASVVGDSGGPLLIGGKIQGILSAAQIVDDRIVKVEDFKYVPTANIAEWVDSVVGTGTGMTNAPGAPSQANPTANVKPAAIPPKQGNGTTHTALPGRIWGKDRVSTAIAATMVGWPYGSPTAVVATGSLAPDALSGSALAAALGAPLLLTTGTHVPPQVVSALKSLSAKTIYLIGAGVVFDAQTQAELTAAGVQTIHIAGADRYVTAIYVAAMIEKILSERGEKLESIFLADGTGFADALGAGTAAGYRKGALLLTNGKKMDGLTDAFLRSKLPNLTSVFIVGGPAVQAAHQAGLNAAAHPAWTEIVGSDRYHTAVSIAELSSFGARSAVLASGQNFPDGLAGGALAVKLGNALVLSETNTLPGVTNAFLAKLPARNATRTIGGVKAISDFVGLQAQKG